MSEAHPRQHEAIAHADASRAPSRFENKDERTAELAHGIAGMNGSLATPVRRNSVLVPQRILQAVSAELICIALRRRVYTLESIGVTARNRLNSALPQT